MRLHHAQPEFAHLKPKALETGELAANSVIVEVALNDAPQPFPDFQN
jgi:hypothetical protein